MAVTIFPAATNFTFGSTSEAGIATESYEQNDQVDHYEQKDNNGEIVEVVTFNPRGEITLSGQMTAAAVKILGLSMTFANLVLVQYGGGAATGISIVRGVQQSKNRARNMDIRITATYYPKVTA
jgi:hypothetical protein